MKLKVPLSSSFPKSRSTVHSQSREKKLSGNRGANPHVTDVVIILPFCQGMLSTMPQAGARWLKAHGNMHSVDLSQPCPCLERCWR